MTQSCGNKLDPAKFVPGLKVESWVRFDKVSWLWGSLHKRAHNVCIVSAVLPKAYYYP